MTEPVSNPDVRASEVELARAVIQWLDHQHWDVYQEVRVGPRGRIADIIAVRGPLTWVIECKKALGLEVLTQANDWPAMRRSIAVFCPAEAMARQTGLAAARRAGLRQPSLPDLDAGAAAGAGPVDPSASTAAASASTVATARRGLPAAANSAPPRLRPRPGFPVRRTTSRDFAIDVCRVYGVGVIEVGPTGRVHERIPAPILRGYRRSSAFIRRHLSEEHKRRAPAGSAGAADRWSPYRQTMEQVRAILAGAGDAGCTLPEIMQRLQRQHHWNTEPAARMNLALALREWVDWCAVIEEGKRPRYCFCAPPDPADAAPHDGAIADGASHNESVRGEMPRSAAGAGGSRPVLFPPHTVDAAGADAGEPSRSAAETAAGAASSQPSRPGSSADAD